MRNVHIATDPRLARRSRPCSPPNTLSRSSRARLVFGILLLPWTMAACGGAAQNGAASSTTPPCTSKASQTGPTEPATSDAETAAPTTGADDAGISGPAAVLKPGVVHETPRLFKLIVELPFEDVEITLQAEIGRQNFSVLQTLDVQRGLKNRGVEFPAFRVYQFCTLQHAWALFEDNKDFGAFIPCSILIYEEGEKTVVVARKFAADLVRIEGYKPVPEALDAAEQIDRQVRLVFEAIREDAMQ